MEELKETIIRTLDAAGVLDKIRAQLRLNVFKAVQNDEGKIHIDKSKAISATQTSEGKLSAYLFRDFMECYKMKFSLNVFVPESHLPPIEDVRAYLQTELRISPPSDVPFLAFMIQTLTAKPETKHAQLVLNPEPAVKQQPAPVGKANLVPLNKLPLPNIPPLNPQKIGKFVAPQLDSPSSSKSESPPPAKPAPFNKAQLANIPPMKNQKPATFVAPELDSYESESEEDAKPVKLPSNIPPLNHQKAKFVPPEIDSGSLSDSPRNEDWKKKANKFDSVDEEKKRLQDIEKRILEINQGDSIKKFIDIERESPEINYEEEYEEGSQEYYEENYSEDEIYNSVILEDYDIREPVELVQSD